jgi:hypothetical protein
MLVVLSAFLLGLFGVLGGVVTAVLVGLGLPAIWWLASPTRRLRPGRTANGSAYALQVESFRRFLIDSEAQYVEWAWKNGLLRQYSAWAVALDAADAWQRSMERAGVPRRGVGVGPLLVHAMAASFNSVARRAIHERRADRRAGSRAVGSRAASVVVGAAVATAPGSATRALVGGLSPR